MRFFVILLSSLLLFCIACEKNTPEVTEGTITMPDGRTYTGQIKNSVPHGNGVLASSEDNRYEGEFVNGRIEGRGTLTLPNGSVYVGEFKNDLVNGRGVLTSTAGNSYDGEWKDGKMHGQGSYSFADGRVKTGRFENGKYVGPDSAEQAEQDGQAENASPAPATETAQ